MPDCWPTRPNEPHQLFFFGLSIAHHRWTQNRTTHPPVKTQLICKDQQKLSASAGFRRIVDVAKAQEKKKPSPKNNQEMWPLDLRAVIIWHFSYTNKIFLADSRSLRASLPLYPFLRHFRCTKLIGPAKLWTNMSNMYKKGAMENNFISPTKQSTS